VIRNLIGAGLVAPDGNDRPTPRQPLTYVVASNPFFLRYSTVCDGKTMRFVLAASGSRGEGDPLIALGMQLQRRGHEVAFIATEDHQSQAHAFGIKFHKVHGNLIDSLSRRENGNPST
jgi:hypothetical protein